MPQNFIVTASNISLPRTGLTGLTRVLTVSVFCSSRCVVPVANVIDLLFPVFAVQSVADNISFY